MLFGCGKKKYKLILRGGLASKKTRYAAGDPVTVYHERLAAGTDPRFCSDDIELKQLFEGDHGIFCTFTMPPHDVTISGDSHSNMACPPALTVTFVSEMQEADLWLLAAAR